MSDSKEMQYGIILIIIATIFLLASLDMIENQVIDQSLSAVISFVMVAVGTYLLGKNS
ncbi:MAG: hypothetical protein HOE11_02355 [Candidatus Diapherotrites archaeon]|nr:hypothetical protein [Candidatus Diapherotrites archaeon]MBT4596971.1 hypothetical protein [Candidatus Diapherotrites archaeon]